MAKNTDKTQISRYIALILRHHPEAAGVSLDAHGWADIDALIAGVGKRYPLDRAMLEEIVQTDDKQRYAISEDGKRIRANQGHSIAVDVGLERVSPPETLWHGTGSRFSASIDAQGLTRQSRLYVHLSTDAQTAQKVGARHGKPVVYRVAAGQMARDGFAFFRSANGVFMTEHVPVKYLKRMDALDEMDGEYGS